MFTEIVATSYFSYSKARMISLDTGFEERIYKALSRYYVGILFELFKIERTTFLFILDILFTKILLTVKNDRRQNKDIMIIIIILAC